MRGARRRRLVVPASVLAVLTALATLAGCTGYSGSVAHQVAQWASQYTVISNDQTVLQDVSAIERSLAAGQLKDVTSNCAGLVFDAGTAYQNLPTPDNTLTNELNAAYEDFANGGSACAAVANLHSAKLSRALKTVKAGVVHLDQATRRLATEGVH